MSIYNVLNKNRMRLHNTCALVFLLDHSSPFSSPFFQAPALNGGAALYSTGQVGAKSGELAQVGGAGVSIVTGFDVRWLDLAEVVCFITCIDRARVLVLFAGDWKG